MIDFDFDDWARLYRRDPAEFEARRHALFAIELAKAAPGLSVPVRSMLRDFDARTAGLSEPARLAHAASHLVESLERLAGQMESLSDAARAALPRH